MRRIGPVNPGALLPGSQDSPRLLLASNREPFRVVRDTAGSVRECIPSMGGLVSGLSPLLTRRPGVWVCWNPHPVAGDSGPHLLNETGDGVPFPLLQVGLRKSEIQGYYFGFCNRVLWPMFHTILRRVSPRLDYWQQFRSINERFAEVIASQARPDDVVWLHDYHLMLVPQAIRRRIRTPLRVGYFHHVPFPEPAVLKALPWHRQLLSGILGADAVGFHTTNYAFRFLESCSDLLGHDIDSDPGTVIHGNRKTVVRARPIGIDTEAFARMADQSNIKRRAAAIRRRFACDCLMLSVDRLDYTKGLLERVEAIHELFTRLPQCRGIVTFLQIAVPTRTGIADYQEYRARFETAVRRLNEEFGNDEWQPLICHTKPLSRRELVSHYVAADVACVTPLADGMNLVALEYCASRRNNDGVLVLSRQAGASTLLSEYAVTVDTCKIESIVTGFVHALTMPPDERRLRMTELRSIVMRATSERWTSRCLNDIGVWNETTYMQATSVS